MPIKKTSLDELRQEVEMAELKARLLEANVRISEARLRSRKIREELAAGTMSYEDE